jgi:hypothetical protein
MDRALNFLERPNVHPVSEYPAKVKASEILRLWRVRQKNTKITGHIIHGIGSLIKSLEHLPADLNIDQFGFIDGNAGGIFWFKERNGDFVGIVLSE